MKFLKGSKKIQVGIGNRFNCNAVYPGFAIRQTAGAMGN